MHYDIKERATPETKYLFILLCNRLLLISYFVLGTEHGTGELMVKKPRKTETDVILVFQEITRVCVCVCVCVFVLGDGY